MRQIIRELPILTNSNPSPLFLLLHLPASIPRAKRTAAFQLRDRFVFSAVGDTRELAGMNLLGMRPGTTPHQGARHVHNLDSGYVALIIEAGGQDSRNTGG